MQSDRETLLCDYRYDPLDRLTVCTQSEHTGTQRFYLQNRLATEVQGTVQRSIIQHQDQLLAQQQRENGAVETTLLATDQQRSVLNALDTTGPRAFAYAPYGHRIAQNGALSLLGFNGERPDPVTGHYLLGNGYRAFNPVLMRFNSPDSWSPFGKGGLNAYGYCVGDPVNKVDPTGHFFSLVSNLGKKFTTLFKPTRSIAENPNISFSDKIATTFDELSTTTQQSFNRNKNFQGPISESRHYLNEVISSMENPPPYAQKAGAINFNLASHGDSTLTMDQAKNYGILAQNVDAGKLSNTGAHAIAVYPWMKKFISNGDPRAFLGAVFNAGGALTSGVVDKSLQNTGKALRRGSGNIR